MAAYSAQTPCALEFFRTAKCDLFPATKDASQTCQNKKKFDLTQQSQDDVPFQYDTFRDSQATLEAVHLPWKAWQTMNVMNYIRYSNFIYLKT